MDAGDRRSIQFAITNENPVLITIKQLRNSLEAFSTLRLVGVEPGNQTVLANPPSFATDSTSSVDNWITVIFIFQCLLHSGERQSGHLYYL
jgi:hypothetical protein